MITTDTAVIGAGPAGAAAAHRLATAGSPVLLIDKATFPRDKFCGDGLTALALRRLDDMGFDPAQVASWTPVGSAHLRSPNGSQLELPLPSNGLFAAIARRSDLDHALVRHADRAGAELRLGSALTSIDVEERGVRLTLADDTEIRAQRCIAADGMWSPTRKLLGLEIEGYRGEWHAFRQYFENTASTASEQLWVWFEPDLLPGYAWSFPLGGGRANVGFGILRGGAIPTQAMKNLWPDILGRPHIRKILGDDARPEAPHRAWPIPARIDDVPLVGPRTFFVGDAAAACDPLTGEGIGQALFTGRAAAEAVLDHPERHESAADQYVDRIHHELFADHRMSVSLGRLMRSRRVADVALRAVGATAWTRRNAGRWLFEDYPRAMLATPGRWHRGMFTGPGAFRASRQ